MELKRLRLLRTDYDLMRSEWWGLPRNGVFRAAIKAIGMTFGHARPYVSGDRWFH